jgi:hypothetical protein
MTAKQYPQAGETWFDRDGNKHGPLKVYDHTGKLFIGEFIEHADCTWFHTGAHRHVPNQRDLVSRVEPLPEPVRFWVREWENQPLAEVLFNHRYNTRNELINLGCTNPDIRAHLEIEVRYIQRIPVNEGK